ncbi:MAG TPA: hypothetical protein VN258_10415 [Mobilitalea sp.]|nr:hypothetical protein [Mobilitalea sp.]
MSKKIMFTYFIIIISIFVIGCGVKDKSDEVTLNTSDAIGTSQVEVTGAPQTEETITSSAEVTVAPSAEATITPTTEAKQADPIELRAMQEAELWTGGKMFEDVSESDTKYFLDKVSTLTIPDARKGERAANIQDQDWNKGLVFLSSIPEKNIYLYGFNDEKLYGFGLILDIGKEQHIYTYPIPYMTSHAIAPAISSSEDGNTILISCLTGTGTGLSVSQLYVIQVNNDKAEAFYVDVDHLIKLLQNKLSMTYDAKNNIVTINSEGNQIATDSLIGAEGIPKGFYCGNFIDYRLNNESVRVNSQPVYIDKERAGIDNYLENISLEADIKFEYDSDGKIIGFDIGEITAVNKTQQ